jgi:hypothetical protein
LFRATSADVNAIPLRYFPFESFRTTLGVISHTSFPSGG